MALLTEVLLEWESLDTADIRELFEKGALSRPKPIRTPAASETTPPSEATVTTETPVIAPVDTPEAPAV